MCLRPRCEIQRWRRSSSSTLANLLPIPWIWKYGCRCLAELLPSCTFSFSMLRCVKKWHDHGLWAFNHMNLHSIPKTCHVNPIMFVFGRGDKTRIPKLWVTYFETIPCELMCPKARHWQLQDQHTGTIGWPTGVLPKDPVVESLWDGLCLCRCSIPWPKWCREAGWVEDRFGCLRNTFTIKF